jgi:hypothetical protein
MRRGEGNDRCLEQRSEGRHFELVKEVRRGQLKVGSVGMSRSPEALIKRKKNRDKK